MKTIVRDLLLAFLGLWVSILTQTDAQPQRRLEGTYRARNWWDRSDPIFEKHPYLVKVLHQRITTVEEERAPIKFQSLRLISPQVTKSSPILIRKVRVSNRRPLPTTNQPETTQPQEKDDREADKFVPPVLPRDPELRRRPWEIPVNASKYYQVFTTGRPQVRRPLPPTRPPPTHPPPRSTPSRGNSPQSTQRNSGFDLTKFAELLGIRRHPQVPEYPGIFSMGDRFDVGFASDGRLRIGKRDGLNILGMNFGSDDGVSISHNGFGFGRKDTYGPVAFNSGPNFAINWGKPLTELLSGLSKLG